MTFAAQLQSRFVLVVGGLAAAALALFMVARITVLKSVDASSAAPRTIVQHHAIAPKPAATKPAVVKAPVIVLNDGLPASLARALRREPVVVAALWAPRTGDGAALASARAGAKQSHAGFVALNVLDDRNARLIERLVGTVSSPATVVFERPGKVVNRFDGFADRTVVAQAAKNAGAR